MFYGCYLLFLEQKNKIRSKQFSLVLTFFYLYSPELALFVVYFIRKSAGTAIPKDRIHQWPLAEALNLSTNYDVVVLLSRGHTCTKYSHLYVDLSHFRAIMMNKKSHYFSEKLILESSLKKQFEVTFHGRF